MSMDQFLASYYGTNGSQAPQQEDLEKQASIELFAKLAAAQGIDLDKMPEAEVDALYVIYQEKIAGAQGQAGITKTASEDEEKKKKDEAEKEHEEKKEAAAKVAEADMLGRVMAHAYVNEMKKIASDQGDGDAAANDKTAGHFSGQAGDVMMKARGMGDKLRAATHHVGAAAKGAKEKTEGHLANLGAKIHHTAHGKGPVTEGKAKAIGAGAYGAGAAAAGGGAAAAAHKKEKKGSALDELAAVEAVKKASAAGWDTDEASNRVAAVLVLGAPEDNSKVAQAADLYGAVDVRACELLEMAGYPVNWE